MRIQKRLKKELRQLRTPEKERVLPLSGEPERTAPRRSGFRRFATAPVAVALAVLLVLGGVAAGPAVWDYINSGAVKNNNLRVDTVPEGYTGIYTAEDLDRIREQQFGNYILMSDIVFTDADYAPGGICEGGWRPIDDAYGSWNGIFNGNGYVIRNLKIRSGTVHTSDWESAAYYGLFGQTNGHFINLGIEDCEIIASPELQWPQKGDHLHFASDRVVCVGSIAAKADFIGACYAENVTVRVDLSASNTQPEQEPGALPRYVSGMADVGGLAGVVNAVDSCKSNAVVDVRNGESFVLRAGGLAGAAFAVVTSYAEGAVYAEASEFTECYTDLLAVCNAGSSVPIVLTKQAMQAFAEALSAEKGEFYKKLFFAFYMEVSPSYSDILSAGGLPNDLTEGQRLVQELVEKRYRLLCEFGYTSVETERDCELLVSDSSVGESAQLSRLLCESFGGYERFREVCAETGIKCGLMYSYGIEPDQKLGKSDFEGFDFRQVWVWKDGRPQLRVFGA